MRLDQCPSLECSKYKLEEKRFIFSVFRSCANVAMLLPHEKTGRVVPSHRDESNWADREEKQRQGPQHPSPCAGHAPRWADPCSYCSLILGHNVGSSGNAFHTSGFEFYLPHNTIR